jgi:DNA-binding transcriptional ArsR family regulator
MLAPLGAMLPEHPVPASPPMLPPPGELCHHLPANKPPHHRMKTVTMRAAHFASVFVIGLVLLPSVQAQTVEVGPLEAEVKFEKPHQCSVGIGEELCFVSWDPGDDASHSDDEINATHTVKKVRIAVSTPGEVIPPIRFEFVPGDDLVVRHSLNPILNATWTNLNETLPEAAQGFVTFEVGRVPSMAKPRPQGLMIVVHSPTPIDDPTSGYTWSERRTTVYAWDCGYYFTTYANGDKTCSYDDLRPFPNGFYNVDSTDRMVDATVAMIPCSAGYTNVTYQACPFFEDAEAVGLQAASAWKNITPNAGVGGSVKNVKVEVGSQERSEWRDDSGILDAISGRVQDLNIDVQRDSNTSTHSPAEGGPAGQRTPAPPLAKSPIPPASISIARAPITRSPAHGSTAFVIMLAVGASILALLAWVLYARIGPGDDLLSNPNRRRIFELIKERPGIRAGSLVAPLGLSYAVVRRHLDVLERTQMIEGTNEGQRRYFAKSNALNPSKKMQILASSAAPAKLIIDHVSKHGETDFADLVKRLGMSYPTASRLVKRLDRAHLLRKERRGGRLILVAMR